MLITKLVCTIHHSFSFINTNRNTGFKLQALLLSRMFFFVESGKIQAPLYTADQAPAGTSNSQFLREYVATILRNAFAHLQPAQIKEFVDGLFSLNNDLVKFKLCLRDFLISLKEFSDGDNTGLFAEDRELAAEEARKAEREKASKVGGLLKPSEMDDEIDL